MRRFSWTLPLAIIALLPISNQVDAAPLSSLPNIVIILADDLGYSDISYNDTEAKIQTPYIDELAARGMRFTDGHSSSGVCSPSRYSLLTGRYHWRGALADGIVNSFEDSVVEPDRLTIADMLKAQGYQTAMIGKWHLGFNWSELLQEDAQLSEITINKRIVKYYESKEFDWSKPITGGPVDCGFDYYFGDGTINFPPYAWIHNNRVTEIPSERFIPSITPEEGSVECRIGPMVPGWRLEAVLPTLTEKATDWILQQASHDTPFFLYVSLPSPHAPIIPNKTFQGTSQAGPYGDFVQQTDWSTGQIINALKKIQKFENTLIIFTSDNGPEHYAYQRIQKHDHNSTEGLRGLKRDLYEGGHRVPLIATWPAQIRHGSLCNETVSSLDLMATCAAITNYELPHNAAEDSYDLSPLFREEATRSPFRPELVHHTLSRWFGIRIGDWVLIDHNTGHRTRAPAWYTEPLDTTAPKTEALLYNLADDPQQTNNLYNSHPEVAERLKARLETIKAAPDLRR